MLINPSQQIVLPKIARKLPATILTAAEVARFLGAIEINTALGIRDRAMFETLYSTGLRIGELLALIPADVDLVEGYVRVRHGKGGKSRIVPLGRVAARWIEKYLDAGRRGISPALPMFLSWRTNRPLDRGTVSKILRGWLARSGLKKRVTCHGFRHACASHMLRGRASLRHIQEMLGHASPTTTQIYTHVEILDLKRVHDRCHPRSRR
jgi:integrase/recombinase XerD